MLANRSETSLMDAACRKTGLSDWGNEDFLIPLQILIESYRKDARLNHSGWIRNHELIIHHLCNRLLIQNTINSYPEIRQEQIHHPLFIVGMPRTGTTFLHRLISQDPSNRSPLFWETRNPAPPPDIRTYDTDPRIEHTNNHIKNLHKATPELPSIHLLDARVPEECMLLLANNFVSTFFRLFATIPQYMKWLYQQDMIPTYRYHREQIKILQFRYPTCRWVLKAPEHMFAMQALLSIYPDACIVQTHRDLYQSIPSLCSLLSVNRKSCSDDLDRTDIGKESLYTMKTWTDMCLQARKTIAATSIFDLRYEDLIRDPIGMVRNIYDYFGYQFETVFEKRMCEYLAVNRQHKHGVHKYSLEQFGLTVDMVNRTFQTYCDRFKISHE